MDERKIRHIRFSPKVRAWSLGGVTILLLFACMYLNYRPLPEMTPVYGEYSWVPDCSEGHAPASPFVPEEIEFLRNTLNAVNRGDVKWLVARYRYPEYVDTGMSNAASFVFESESARAIFEKVSGRPYYRLIVRLKREINSSDELEFLLREKLTPDVRKKILDDARDPLFKNYKGMMIGNGILWVVPEGNTNGDGYSIVINYN